MNALANSIPPNELWQKEEFEDLVARGLISMYETKFKRDKKILKVCQINDKLLRRIKNLGCYFPSNDRIVAMDHEDKNNIKAIQELDILNEPLPRQACYSMEINSKDNDTDMRKDCYLEHYYLERLISFPYPIQSKYKGVPYRLVTLWFNKSNLLEGFVQYSIIQKDGLICPTYFEHVAYDRVTGRPIKHIVSTDEIRLTQPDCPTTDLTTLGTHFTIQYYNDRRFLWNVRAQEGIAKATFTVYPEQIKSLFYSRTVPLTETGRKRPILHWVRCHRRRLEKGIDIDITKHLRGIEEFEYQGTYFKIINPTKNK